MKFAKTREYIGRIFTRNKTTNIQLYDKSFDSDDSIESLQKRIQSINLEIQKYSSYLIESEKVRINSLFSKQRGFFSRIQANVYQRAAENSSSYYLSHLRKLYKNRLQYQLRLEIRRGSLIPSLLRLLLRILLVILLFLFAIGLIFVGFISLLHIIPVLLLVYFLARLFDRSNKFFR